MTRDGTPSSRRLVCRKTSASLDGTPSCPHADEACKFRTECVVYALDQEESAGNPVPALEAERAALEDQIAALEAQRPGHDSRGGRFEMRLFALQERLDEVRATLERLSGDPSTPSP